MDLHLFEESIKKTGFFLEFRVSEALKERGWSIINNRYYIDDQSETVREIDIVAFKTGKVRDITVFTTLIISCKKNKENLWALLSKDIYNDRNFDWKPVHIWTNNKIIEFTLSTKAWKDEYYHYISQSGVKKTLFEPDVHIFAFQEMNILSGAVKNDASMFGAVTSLMKAQAFEMASLPRRKKNSNCVYQFNLLSVIDTDLIRLHFDKNKINGYQIEQENYVGKYIINKEETFSRVHFVKESALFDVLSDYDLYHQANIKFIEKLNNDFYSDSYKDHKKLDLLKERFIQLIRSFAQSECNFLTKVKLIPLLSPDKTNLYSSPVTSILTIEIICTKEELEVFKNDPIVKSIIIKGLKEVYEYEGAFSLDYQDPDEFLD